MSKDLVQGVPTGYRVKLSVSERLNLGALFPQKGNMISMQLAEDITEKTKLSTEELDQIAFKTIDVPSPQGVGSRSSWDPKKGEDKQIEFTKTEMRFLKKQVEKLDKAEGISVNLFSLCKKLDAFKVEEK